jgi:hypothetical protein
MRSRVIRRLVPRLAVSAVGLAWLQSFAACGPAIDRAARADVDRMSAAMEPKARLVPADARTSTIPLSPGQWSSYRVTRKGGTPSFIVFKVVGEGSGGYSIQTDSVSYGGRSETRVLLRLVGNADAPQAIDVLAMAIKAKDGRLVEQPASVFPLLRPSLQKAFSQLVTDWRGLSRESVTVTAGAFVGCFRRREMTDWGHVHEVSDSWSHPAVPIFGLVLSKGVEKPYVMELIGFGVGGDAPQL